MNAPDRLPAVFQDILKTIAPPKLSIVDTIQSRIVASLIDLAEIEHRLSGLPHDEAEALTATLDHMADAMVNLKDAQVALSAWVAPRSVSYGAWK